MLLVRPTVAHIDTLKAAQVLRRHSRESCDNQLAEQVLLAQNLATRGPARMPAPNAEGSSDSYRTYSENLR